VHFSEHSISPDKLPNEGILPEDEAAKPERAASVLLVPEPNVLAASAEFGQKTSFSV